MYFNYQIIHSCVFHEIHGINEEVKLRFVFFVQKMKEKRRFSFEIMNVKSFVSYFSLYITFLILSDKMLLQS